MVRATRGFCRIAVVLALDARPGAAQPIAIVVVRVKRMENGSDSRTRRENRPVPAPPKRKRVSYTDYVRTRGSVGTEEYSPNGAGHIYVHAARTVIYHIKYSCPYRFRCHVNYYTILRIHGNGTSIVNKLYALRRCYNYY